MRLDNSAGCNHRSDDGETLSSLNWRSWDTRRCRPCWNSRAAGSFNNDGAQGSRIFLDWDRLNNKRNDLHSSAGSVWFSNRNRSWFGTTVLANGYCGCPAYWDGRSS